MKKFTAIELDKTRNLRYGMVAISLIEEKLNKVITDIDFEKLKMIDLGVVIWAGLVHEDEKLKQEDILALIDDYSDIPTVTKAMGEAMQEAFGKNGVRTAKK